MFAVIFEVRPKPERWDAYLALATLLKPEVEQIDGFIDNERFASRRTHSSIIRRFEAKPARSRRG
jgi:heme-degrading monooxygenase HmoA